MFHVIRTIDKKTKMIVGSILLIFIYVAPFFILRGNAHMPILDNMDSNMAWYRVLKNSGQLFAPLGATVPQVINGLPRADLYSEFYGIIFLYMHLPPVIAYGLNELITRLFAFLGMYLLLKDYFLADKKWTGIQIGVALSFALVPFWPNGMLSQLGMPLALWAFLNIRGKKSSWKDYLILTLLPFYSTFVLGFFFFLSAMGAFWLWDIIKKRGWNWRFFLSIAYMTLIYLAIEYRLVFSLILSHEPTQRTEFKESNNSFLDTLLLFLKNLVIGHRQDQVIHTPIILPIILLTLGLIWRKQLWQKARTLTWLSGLFALLSLWYAFWFFDGWQPLKEKVSILTTFNFSRFHYLHPIIIYIAFALALKLLWEYLVYKQWGKKIVKIALILQVVILFGCNAQIYYHFQPTFKQFYAVHQFQEIKNYIHKPVQSYRVASIGIHPAIAQYNGFYTLDTYSNFYPLSYKHKFRKIIAKELDKSPELKKYFDDWGSRCYIFVAQLGKHYMYDKHSTIHIKHLQLNLKPFKQMGGKYLISALPIDHPGKTGLKLAKVFHDKSSAWTIYLYQVI